MPDPLHQANNDISGCSPIATKLYPLFYLISYVVVENLRYMLYQYSSSQPIYFGCKFKPYVKQVRSKTKLLDEAI